MPTYEYKCNMCQHKFEEYQSIVDLPLVNCPNCKQKSLERIFSTGGVLLFKGTGFYLTDYKKTNGSASSNGAPKKDEKPSTESKPAPANKTTPEKSAGQKEEK
jgi:putative FmdB family regulatory protein